MDQGSRTAHRILLSANQRVSIAAGLLLVCVATLYFLFPTKNYYWDGITFAQHIEDSGSAGFASLFHPNHLLYDVVGWCFFRPLHSIFPELRALDVLQRLNSLLSIICCYVFFRCCWTTLRDLYSTIVGSCLFAFSATWWKFSVDANSYILSALLLLLCFSGFASNLRFRFWRTAILHAGAMLIHELAALFIVPIFFMIRSSEASRSRSKQINLFGAYSGLVGAFTVAVYYLCFLQITRSQPKLSFMGWVASHSEDSVFTANLFRIVPATLDSYLRLLFGGRLRFWAEFLNPWTAALTIIGIAFLGILCYLLVRYRADFLSLRGAPPQKSEVAPVAVVALAWVSVYLLFLLFWLPWNTFYKLFLWPPLVWLIAFSLTCCRLRMKQFRFRAALFVCCLMIWNLLLLTYPSAQPSANPVFVYSKMLKPMWPPDTVVYYRAFTPDDWFVRYFNPQSTWIQTACRDQDCINALAGAARLHGSVWMDTSLLEELEHASNGTQQLLARVTETRRELTSGGHYIRFAKIAAWR